MNPEILQTISLKNGDKMEVVINKYIYKSAPTEAGNEERFIKITKIHWFEVRKALLLWNLFGCTACIVYFIK